MAVDRRAEIFRLRESDPPLSYAEIGRRLGISKSTVSAELKRRAGGGGASAGSVSPTSSGSPSAAVDQLVAQDPDVMDRRRSVELARLRTQELEAEARQLEAQGRLELLKNPGGANSGNQMAAIFMTELSRIRDQIQSNLARPAAAPPTKSLVDQLGEARGMMDMIRSFAPPQAPSTGVELEFKVAMQRLEFENQRIMREVEDELKERRERQEGQRSRDEAIAKAIDQFAPVAALALQRYLERDNQPPAPAAQALPPARPTVLEGGQSQAPAQAVSEVQGSCPRCGAQLAMTPGGEDDSCPSCGAQLVVADGAIAVREAAPAAAGVQTFAS